MTHIYVRRFDKAGNDLGAVDIPEKDLTATLKRNPLWKVVVEEKKEEVKVEGIGCPLCDFVAKSEFGLKAHKRKHT